MPAKRKNKGKQASNGNAKQAKQEGQKAVSHDINVPIDEGFKEGKCFAASRIDWQDRTCNCRVIKGTPKLLTDPWYRRCQSLHRRQWDYLRCLFKPNKHRRKQQQVLPSSTFVQRRRSVLRPHPLGSCWGIRSSQNYGSP